MRLVRGLILPTIIAGPLSILASRAQLSGFPGLTQLDVGDWVFGMFLALIGLLVVGLPAAWKIRRLQIPASIKLILLAIAGAVGGGFFAMLFPLSIAALSGRVDLTTIGNSIAIATYGCVPGIVVALVWIIFNFDNLQASNA